MLKKFLLSKIDNYNHLPCRKRFFPLISAIKRKINNISVFVKDSDIVQALLYSQLRGCCQWVFSGGRIPMLKYQASYMFLKYYDFVRYATYHI